MYELYAQKITEYKCKWLTQKMQTTAWRMLQGAWFITTGSQVGKGKSEVNNTKYWLPAWHKPVSKKKTIKKQSLEISLWTEIQQSKSL